MATVSTIPTLVLPGKPAQLVFTASAGGNLVKVWCTSAPRGSKLRSQLDQAQAERVVVISESDIDKRPQYTFDVGGVYQLQVEEFTKGAEAYGGRYRGDPDGFRTESRVANAVQSVSVATLLTCDLGVQPDTATLQVYVSGDNVIETTIASHGFASPAIVNPRTTKSKAATDSAQVIAALDDMTGVYTTVIGNVTAEVNDFIDKFNEHHSEPIYHATADTGNAIDSVFASPRDTKALQRCLSELSRRLGDHISNIHPDASPPDPGSGNWHEIASDPAVDWDSMLLASGGSTMNECRVLFADITRCYSTHLQWSGHTNADTVNELAAVSPLTALHAAFLSSIASATPAVPANEHPAKVGLVNGAGFKEA